ncbi:MAG: hypothetical protein ABT15_28140 [Pseudonocardia sp. SCN 73-27]|nr:MAG: hypothetical protein ABS80_06780 [Pseudonocardia sp. SCN 72-51]ODV01183.1 MAG: hypothetical protein ABT15_28140 [Pseudonocardia sp. SCN 73-27]
MTRAVPSPSTPAPPTRERRRADIAARLLDSLESLLTRHRALLVEPTSAPCTPNSSPPRSPTNWRPPAQPCGARRR